MSSSENNWSFTDWQCGMGVVDSCKNQKINWDEPKSWQALVDQLIPLTEFGIVFTLQYISSSIGPGTTKAMNSLRCMFNSGTSSLWYLGAGSWLLLKYAGVTADLVGYLDEGYLYACTCIYDLNGLKSMLGASEESSAEFSSCSEKGREERIKAREEKEAFEAKQREAAANSLIEAAKNKKISDSKIATTGLDGCADRTASSLSEATCFAAAEGYRQQAIQIVKYWNNMVQTSGGAESTKNREEQTNLKEAGWTLEGAVAGLKEMFPDRYGEDGELLQSCAGSAGTVYGDSCTAIIEQYAVDNGVPNALCLGEACKDTVSCFRGNVADGNVLTTEASCDLVELEYGYSQWRESASITCRNPITQVEETGWDNCMIVDGTYASRAGYTNVNQARFRTIGETLPVDAEGNDRQGDVLDSDIQCLAADNVTVRNGSANCWPYWIEGGDIEIGLKADLSVIKQDQFIWLTTEGVECTQAGTTLQGTANCKVDNEVVCNSSKLTRLNLTGSGVANHCVGAITWKAK